MNLYKEEEHNSDATEFHHNDKLSKAQKDNPNYNIEESIDKLKQILADGSKSEIIYVSLNAVKEYDDEQTVALFQTFLTIQCTSINFSSELTEDLRENGV